MTRVDTIVAPIIVPGHRQELFDKAAASGADAVIIDLEDAVAEGEKQAARAALRTDFTNLPVVVRINGVASPYHNADLCAVARHHPDAIMVPKAEAATLEHLLATCPSDLTVIALVETAQGVVDARRIADFACVRRICFGSLDYCADLGCAERAEILLPARSELVLASKVAGLPGPIDGVTAAFRNLEATRADALHARDVGMAGKLCIHPTQVPVVQMCFTPSADEITWARSVLTNGDGVQSVDDHMVDAPIRQRARAILDRLPNDPLSKE